MRENEMMATKFSEKLAAEMFCMMLMSSKLSKEDKEKISKYWNDDHKERKK